VALPVKALKAGQESYWLDQIARNGEEYFSGRGESLGRFIGSAAATASLEGIASPEQVRAMFQGLDPATGEQRCAPLWRADPRSKLTAGPLLAALNTRAAEQGVDELEVLAGSKALKGDVRSVEAACRLGGAKRVKVKTVERLCRKVLGVDPCELYGEGFDQAWQHRGKRVNERVQAFDHCFSSPKSASLLAAAGSPRVRQLLAEGRSEALQVSIQYLERHGLGVRRDHNGTDRYQAVGGLVAVAFEHRMSRAGDPNLHTHVLVQNAAQGPDGRWTALDSDRLYAHLMAADHLYLAAERAALNQRLGVRWGSVDERSGAAEIIGLDDRTLIERFSKRSEQIDQWLDTHGLSGIKASSAAAVATRQPKDYSESEESVYQRWADVEAIAARLRATPAAVSAWLVTRNGTPTKPQAKVTTKQPAKAKTKPKPKPPEKAPTITLGHLWVAKKPNWLYRCTLVTRYEVRPDGTVWSTLDQVLGPDGEVVEDFWRLPLDFRPTQQVTGNGRKLVLKDRTIAGRQTWLIRAGLTTPEDITT
jgi:conjugative relaxase-like TrwC/TraI family protein